MREKANYPHLHRTGTGENKKPLKNEIVHWRHFNALISNISSPLFIIHPSGAILGANEQALGLLDCESDNITGIPFHRFLKEIPHDINLLLCESRKCGPIQGQMTLKSRTDQMINCGFKAWKLDELATGPVVIEAFLKKHIRDDTEALPETMGTKISGSLEKFRALYELGLAMTQGRTLDENLELLVSKSRELLKSDTSYIALRDEKAGDVYMRTLSGIRTEAFKNMRIPFGKGWGGKVSVTGKGYIVEDYFKEVGPLLHDIVKKEGVISGVACPVQIGATNLGVLYVFNRTRRKYTQEDLDTLTLFGNLAAVEITRKRDEQALKKAGEYLEKRVEERTAELWEMNAKLISEISERKKVEKALLKSESMLSNILEASPIGISYVENGRLKWTNQEMAEMFGATTLTSYFNLKTSDFYFTPEEYSRVVSELFNSLKSGRPAETEARFKRRDGSTFHGRIRISALDNEDARRGTITTITDISARRKAELALRESEEKHRTIIENIEDMYYEVDLEGNFTFLNDAVISIFGITKEEAVGRNFSDMSAPESAADLSRMFRKVFDTGMSVAGAELTYISNNGGESQLEISVSPIRNSSSEISGFRGICRDVSERRRALEERLKLEKMESIGVLAGGIAHDFNNILTAIQGNISVAALAESGSENRKKYLVEAERAVTRAGDLTRQLLTFSKGGAPIRVASSIAEVAVDSCEFAARGANAKLKFVIPEDIWTVEIDEVQISQVLGNLVINALQAMPSGGVITVRLCNEELRGDKGLPLPANRYVRISVLDTGVGIDKELLPKIFDPYFTTRSEGNGLGLATAYSIIKNHDGLITVESEPGKGSVFHVYIPATTAKPEPKKDHSSEIISGTGKVLIMDDETAIRTLAEDLVSMLGYSATTVSDGYEALEAYKKSMENSDPYDVVILDLTIPGSMGGYESLLELRRLDPNVKAIVSSGYSNDPIMANYSEFGFNGVIPKPYSAHRLAETINNVIKGVDRLI